MSCPGFYKAPITKAVFLTTIGSSVMMPEHTKRLMSLDIASVLSKGDWWRPLSCHIPFKSYFELFFGLVILYKFRIFERMLGSEKFGAFLIFVTSLATSIQAGIAISLSPTLGPTTGPYSFLYALFYFYHALVPQVQPRCFGLMGVHFTDKSFNYVAGFTLLISQGFQSFLPGMCGIFAGWLYVNDLMSIQKCRPPSFLSRVCKIFAPILHDSPPAQRRRAPGQRNNTNQNTAPPRPPIPSYTPVAPIPAIPEAPREADIATLMSMGFERDMVIEALQRSSNNVQVAADRLVTVVR